MPAANGKPLPNERPGYKPSPQKPIAYTGPDIPTAYDPDWQHFKNLTPAQIAWFQAQPEWQNFLAYVALSPKTATAGVPVAVVNAALAVVAALNVGPVKSII